MMARCLVAAALACLAGAVEGQVALVAVQDASGTETARFASDVSFATAGVNVEKKFAATAETAEALPLVFDSFGCEALTGEVPAGNFALVVRRGECTFAQKAATATASNAQLLIVVNNIDSLYNETTEQLFNPCSLNCQTSQSPDEETCASSCPSSTCAKNPRNDVNSDFCCVLNNALSMNITGESVGSDMAGLFVGFNNEQLILDAVADGLTVKVFLEDDLNVDGSMFIILLLGSSVTAFASYRAARSERQKASYLWRAPVQTESTALVQSTTQKILQDGDAVIESVTLSLGAVAAFVIFCSAALIGLFYLATAYPSTTVIVIQVFFGLSACYAVSHFFLQPIVRTLWPSSKQTPVILHWNFGSADEFLGTFLAFALVCFWFFTRHQSYAWVLLDILAMAVCCMFLVSIRLPNMRLACIALVLFFIYDIFMVFISPLVFDGRSVMVEVATAGQSEASISTDSLECIRTQEERMPMLFMVPRFSSDGFALLGLGDIFIPGLLMTYACRFDYLKAMSIGKRTKAPWRLNVYFLPMCFAYFMGLLVTLLANLFELNFSTQVKGQPALLYLVPFTLCTFLGMAYVKGDLHKLWNFEYSELERMMLQPSSPLGSVDVEANQSRGSSASMGSEGSGGAPSRISASYDEAASETNVHNDSNDVNDVNEVEGGVVDEAASRAPTIEADVAANENIVAGESDANVDEHGDESDDADSAEVSPLTSSTAKI